MDFLGMFCWFTFTFIVFVESDRQRDEYVSGDLTMCVVESKHTAKRIRLLCPKLAEQHSEITCSVGIDRFDCLRQVTDGNAHFTVLEPEDLLTIRNYNLYNVTDFLITNELRIFNEDQHFAVVVIAHKNVQRASDIKGKRLCHPGIATTDDWTKPLSMYFENILIIKDCWSNLTLLENRMHALSKYVEMACVAGPWSSDKTFDFHLKSEYKNLCEACYNPASCYMTDKYYGRQGALLCLTDNVGDVVWARLDDAKLHFKTESVRISDYKFLCQDGTTKSLDFNQICSWISKPWPVIVAKPPIANTVAEIMNIMLARNRSTPWVQNVLQLLERYYITSDSLPELSTVSKYLKRFPNFLSAYIRSGCRPSREVIWCVSTDLEKRKCDWMKAAADAYGVEPTIECVLMSRPMCMKAVQISQVDVMMVSPVELLEARRMNLKPIVNAMTNTKNGTNRIVAIVKENSKFKTMTDLRDAKAVFTGYRNIDWNVFVMYMKYNLNESWDCSDAQAVATFFSQVCVLGARNPILPDNLFSLCNHALPTAADDLTAFTYLTSDVVDVAFVNLKVIENHTQIGDFYHDKIDYTNVNRMPKYRTLGLTVRDTLKKDAPNVLAWSSLGSIVTYENITNTRHLEIYTMLIEMDKLFGENFNGVTPAFLMYRPFDNKTGVIFPEGTRYLELQTYEMKASSYDIMVEGILRQDYCNSGSTNILYFSIVCLCLMVVESIRNLIY